MQKVLKPCNNFSARKIILDDGTTQDIDIKNKIADFNDYDEDNKKYVTNTYKTKEDMNKELFDFIKILPADVLLNLNSNISKIYVSEGIQSCYSKKNKSLYTGFDLPVIAHEIGHSIDFRDKIADSKELIDIYKDEINSFNTCFPEPVQELIKYFGPMGSGYSGTGLNELIAETNMLLTTHGPNYDKVKIRSEYLVRYFPKTVAKIAELLGYNTKCPVSE